MQRLVFSKLVYSIATDHIVLWKKLDDFINEYGNISWLIKMLFGAIDL